MKFAVIVFPGSSGDADCYHVVKEVIGQEVDYVWHQDQKFPKDYDCVILPGGYSYGNYLRPGSIARFSPIMEEVIDFARQGGLVLGISNGFQILTEAGLLPGSLISNKDLRFVCKDVYLRVENNKTPFTTGYSLGQAIKMPVAHGEGAYICDQEILNKLKENNQIIFRYSTALEVSPNVVLMTLPIVLPALSMKRKCTGNDAPTLSGVLRIFWAMLYVLPQLSTG